MIPNEYDIINTCKRLALLKVKSTKEYQELEEFLARSEDWADEKLHNAEDKILGRKSGSSAYGTTGSSNSSSSASKRAKARMHVDFDQITCKVSGKGWSANISFQSSADIYEKIYDIDKNIKFSGVIKGQYELPSGDLSAQADTNGAYGVRYRNHAVDVGTTVTADGSYSVHCQTTTESVSVTATASGSFQSGDFNAEVTCTGNSWEAGVSASKGAAMVSFRLTL